MKKVKVFQAGHCYNNNWSVCGYGLTQQQAREELKIAIHRKALKFVASLVLKNPELYNTGEALEGAYKSGAEYATCDRYIEQSYEREE